MTTRIITSLLGLLLIGAGVLKISGGGATAPGTPAWLSSPAMQFAAAEWEIVLGLWLLSGRAAIGAWMAACVTFLGFAAVSLRLGLIGQASCGCFGAVKASPWQAFALDVVALVALGFARPDFAAARAAGWRVPALVAGGAVAVLLLLGGATWAFAGSLEGVLARLRGEALSFRPGVLDVGRGEAGAEVETGIELVNRTDAPVRIVGGTSDCSCITTEDLPITLAPGEARRIGVSIQFGNDPGVFTRKALLHTDCPAARVAVFTLTGLIVPRAEGGAGG